MNKLLESETLHWMPDIFGKVDRCFPTERLRTGATATDVLVEILTIHPEISSISYLVYDILNRSSSINFDSPTLLSIDRDDVDKQLFRNISRSVNEGSERNNAIALASIVSLENGDIAHIPMIDFICEPEFDENLSTNLVAPQPGYLLETDASFHFWGTTLLPHEHWLGFMKHCMRDMQPDGHGELVDVVDKNYVSISLKQGFSALRLLEYPPHKLCEPEVVKVI